MPVIEKRDLLKGASTLVAALAWNEAAKKIIDYAYPTHLSGDKVSDEEYEARKATMFATIIYASVVTVAIMVLISLFNYVSVKVEKESNAVDREIVGKMMKQM